MFQHDETQRVEQAKQSGHLAPQDERAIRQAEAFTISGNSSRRRKPSAHLDGARWLLCCRQPRGLWMNRYAKKTAINAQRSSSLTKQRKA
jgi:hypothetical protein